MLLVGGSSMFKAYIVVGAATPTPDSELSHTDHSACSTGGEPRRGSTQSRKWYWRRAKIAEKEGLSTHLECA